MESRLINPHDCHCIQSRVSLDVFAVAEYARMMEQGIVFDPCHGILCADGRIIIYNGNHRVEAAKTTGAMIEVNLMPGTETDAEWWAAGANSRHGIRRSVSDIEKAVKTALRHAFADGKSDREIARHCGVDHKTVGKYRKELEVSGERPQIDTRTVTRNGTEYQMTIPVPTEPDPEPTPPRAPSPMVYDAHMPTVTRTSQAESTDVEIQNLIKDWVFAEHGHFDVQCAREAIGGALNASIYKAERFYALAEYVEQRARCTRPRIRQACQALLDNSHALDQCDPDPAPAPDVDDTWDCPACDTRSGVRVRGYFQESKARYDIRCQHCGQSWKEPILYERDVFRWSSMTVRCADCGETIPNPADRPDVQFCVECEQARVQERQRLTDVHQRHGLIPSEPEFPQHEELRSEPETEPEQSSGGIHHICNFCDRMLPEAQTYAVYRKVGTSKLIKANICLSCAERAVQTLSQDLTQ